MGISFCQKFLLFSGKVVIDAFRLINPNMVVLGQEPRQTTSNLGHLQKPSIQVIWKISLVACNETKVINLLHRTTKNMNYEISNHLLIMFFVAQ